VKNQIAGLGNLVNNEFEHEEHTGEDEEEEGDEDCNTNTSNAPATMATMAGNAETSVQRRTSPHINKNAPANKTLNSSKSNLLFVYPFDFEVQEEKLQEISSLLTELGGNRFGEAEAPLTVSDDTKSKEECVENISSRKHRISIYVDDRERLKPNIYLNDSLVDLWMSWYVCFCCFLSLFSHNN
jgi:Ulp1 family protease